MSSSAQKVVVFVLREMLYDFLSTKRGGICSKRDALCPPQHKKWWYLFYEVCFMPSSAQKGVVFVLKDRNAEQIGEGCSQI